MIRIQVLGIGSGSKPQKFYPDPDQKKTETFPPGAELIKPQKGEYNYIKIILTQL